MAKTDLVRGILWTSVDENSKYADIASESGRERFVVGTLQRQNRGEGDYHANVFDRHEQKLEKVVIPQDKLDLFLNGDNGHVYASLVTEANELAPYNEEELKVSNQTYVKSKKISHGLAGRIWNSKHMKDLRSSILVHGASWGAVLGIVGYSPILGYTLAVKQDPNEVRMEVVEDRSFNNSSYQDDIRHFNRRLDVILEAEKALEDGFISAKDVARVNGPFSHFDSRKLSKRPVDSSDDHFDNLCSLVSQCRNAIQIRKNAIPEIEDLYKKINDLAHAVNSYLNPEESSQLLSISRSLAEKRNIAISDTEISLDSELGSKVADELKVYKEYMEKLKTNGFFDKLVDAETIRRIEESKSEYVAGGILVGMGASILYCFAILGFGPMLIGRELKEKCLDYQI